MNSCKEGTGITASTKETAQSTEERQDCKDWSGEQSVVNIEAAEVKCKQLPCVLFATMHERGNHGEGFCVCH
jgi:hypothetical protein